MMKGESGEWMKCGGMGLENDGKQGRMCKVICFERRVMMMERKCTRWEVQNHGLLTETTVV